MAISAVISAVLLPYFLGDLLYLCWPTMAHRARLPWYCTADSGEVRLGSRSTRLGFASAGTSLRLVVLLTEMMSQEGWIPCKLHQLRLATGLIARKLHGAAAAGRMHVWTFRPR